MNNLAGIANILTEVLARNPAEIVSKFTVQTIKTI
jgi:hypothetical protein